MNEHNFYNFSRTITIKSTVKQTNKIAKLEYKHNLPIAI